MSMDTTPDKPLIQIDDEVREMTDEEYTEWLSREQPINLGEVNGN